jgi:anti-sigma regulatory factor (Ser/Thr protein kinase)
MLLEDTEVGGLGLYFMRQVMDEVRFQFSAAGNELTMVKRGPSGYSD